MLNEIKNKLAHFMVDSVSLSLEDVSTLLEKPKKSGHGHLSLPVFSLARVLKKAPPLIAQDLVKKIKEKALPDYLKDCQPLGGFINFTFKEKYLQDELLKFLLDDQTIGHSNFGKGKTLVIDFSSPNVAKPMHVGHLRATVIGQAIYNLALTQGYKAVGLNHLGDWGVQFGKLVWAYEQWGDDYDFKEQPFSSLYQLYVRFHAEADKNPDLDTEGAKTFKKLEDGDPEILKLWERFVDISLKEYDRMWSLLGVKHDLVRGESFYNDRLQAVEKELDEKGLTEESDGAYVVRLDEFNLPPCLIRKSDGASLYATRDLASAIYRKKELKADLNLYVVGAEQTLHFQQVFKTLEKMGYEWAKDCHHVSFGLYRFKDMTKFSSRKGNVITLADLLEKAIDGVRGFVEEKNPDLDQDAKDLISTQVGIGAIVFNDLVNDRVKDVEFDWERALSFEGDSGPYIQYCHVRCCGILNKFAKNFKFSFPQDLESQQEIELITTLLNYEVTLSNSFKVFKPHILAGYLLDLCRAFNQFYHAHKILDSEGDLLISRLSLVLATKKVVAHGLSVLSIQSPEQM